MISVSREDLRSFWLTTKEVEDFIRERVTIPDTTTPTIPRPRVPGGDSTFKEPPKPPEIPGWSIGGFSLPFGGGRARGSVPKASRTSFRTRYNPSLAAKVFKIRGTRAQGRAAARTGISVRPIV